MLALIDEAGLSDRVEVDSAGTSGWHIGNPPDERSQATARARGVELRSRARAFEAADFERFDYLLAMDSDNRVNMARLAPQGPTRAYLDLLRNFDPKATADADVPDPYHGGPDGFEHVYETIEAACRGLLAHLLEAHDELRA